MRISSTLSNNVDLLEYSDKPIDIVFRLQLSASASNDSKMASLS